MEQKNPTPDLFPAMMPFSYEKRSRRFAKTGSEPKAGNLTTKERFPQVVASSIYRLRPKLPFWEQGIVPVHQDAGYFDSCADESTVITAWVPLMDATHETGCMEVLPRVHNLGTLRHYNANVAGPGLAVHPDALPSALADTRMEDDSRATVPVPCGARGNTAFARIFKF